MTLILIFITFLNVLLFFVLPFFCLVYGFRLWYQYRFRPDLFQKSLFIKFLKKISGDDSPPCNL